MVKKFLLAFSILYLKLRSITFRGNGKEMTMHYISISLYHQNSKIKNQNHMYLYYCFIVINCKIKIDLTEIKIR